MQASEALESTLREAAKDHLRKQLNTAFREGRRASELEVRKQLQQLEFPILVDFNNVLVNNKQPIIPNPDAPAFLEQLSKIGDVVVITTASSWERVWQILEEAGMTRQVILMVSGNYQNSGDRSSTQEVDYEAMDAYLAMIEAQGLSESLRVKLAADEKELERYQDIFKIEDSEEAKRQADLSVCRSQFEGASANKRVAYLFGKAYVLPLLDDSQMATKNNPGIQGILVNRFEPNPESWEVRSITRHNEESLNLSSAIEEVKRLKTGAGLASTH